MHIIHATRFKEVYNTQHILYGFFFLLLNKYVIPVISLIPAIQYFPSGTGMLFETVFKTICQAVVVLPGNTKSSVLLLCDVRLDANKVRDLSDSTIYGFCQCA